MAGGGGSSGVTGNTVTVELDLITAESLLTALNNAIYGGGNKKKKKKGGGGKPSGGGGKPTSGGRPGRKK